MKTLVVTSPLSTPVTAARRTIPARTCRPGQTNDRHPARRVQNELVQRPPPEEPQSPSLSGSPYCSRTIPLVSEIAHLGSRGCSLSSRTCPTGLLRAEARSPAHRADH